MSKCYCYEKFKDKLPKGIQIKCFKEACKNYRENKVKEKMDNNNDN